MAYPTTIPSYSTKVDGVSYPQAADVNTLQTDTVAIATKLGVDGSAVNTTIDYKLGNIATGQVARPSGEITMFGGASAPSGWLLCNGTSYLRTSYAALFSAIGTTWGSADGTHFNVPDFRDCSPIGSGSSYTLGSAYGAATSSALIAHTHTGTTGDRSAAHTHSGTTGGRSAAHHHDITGVWAHATAFTYEVGTADVNASLNTVASGDESNDHTHNITTGNESAGHTHSFTSNSAGSGSSFSILHPVKGVSFIIKI